MVTLDDPVPDPGPPGPFGTMAWLRATVCRFANGETHARRRAIAEAPLAALHPPRAGRGRAARPRPRRPPPRRARLGRGRAALRAGRRAGGGPRRDVRR